MEDLSEARMRAARLKLRLDQLDEQRDETARLIADLDRKIRDAEMKSLEPRPLLSEPYADKDAAAEALNAFLDHVRKLREQYRIPEVVIGAGAYFTEHDRPVFATQWSQRGDAIRAFFLLESARSELAITAARAAALSDFTPKQRRHDGEA